MKKISLLLLATTFLAVCNPFSSSAQDRNNEDEVVKIDARHSRNAYRPDEIIVKFKPNNQLRARKMKNGKLATMGVRSVDNMFKALGIEEVDALMPLTGAPQQSRIAVRSVSGKTIADPDMTQLYRVKFNAKKVQSVDLAIEQVKQLGEVEYAEPNYLVYSLATEESRIKVVDPLLIQQWGPAAIGLPQLWKAPVINTKRPVIAILDTGVDIEHPDLKDNIWVNTQEQNGADESDDDNNGFADDVHGWDFVNQTGQIGDWNGHGTHCAGIAGAVGDNGIGIKGANPDALIMPVTVMQSDGVGDVATIIKGIDYATANGADVLSMSFGGYAYSKAEEQALGKAYNKAVLVAAAGNDCLPINPTTKCPICKKWGSPMFPAAFTFVLGVEACTEVHGKAVFSNYDDDGPIFSRFDECQLYNYELKAPGAGIMSTYPGGKYKALNGTSMACPMVAGAISRLLQCKDYASKEILFGDLIHTTKGIMNIYNAYQIKDEDRKPELAFVNYELNDTLLGDGDFRADAGESIDLYPTLRNAWGIAENVHFSLEIGENEDPSLITFEKQNIDFGKPLSSYAKVKSENPLRFTINKKCVDGRRIKLRLVATCDNIKEEMAHDLVITVENGVEIGGMITKDMTLYPNVHYIVTKTLAIPEGITLTIKPGTVIKFKDNTGFACSGNLDCHGTPDSMIVFTKADLDNGIVNYMESGLQNLISYVLFEKLMPRETVIINGSNCIFRDITTKVRPAIIEQGTIKQCNLYRNESLNSVVTSNSIACNVIDNSFSNIWFSLTHINDQTINSHGDNFYGNKDLLYNIYINGAYYSVAPKFVTNQHPSYWGSSVEKNVCKYFYDINFPGSTSLGHYDMSNMLTRPNPDAHGCVWKVVVNGYDAQDLFEELPPLGVGKQKFEVYFNRPMDTKFAPNIYMGVRPPYTQNNIAEEGSWNADSTIYTAYLTITGKTATDGLNRIYVDGAKDMDHFEIPVEKFRFNVEVSAAGSMSTGLMAEPGLGKVSLKWVTDEADFADLMGYQIQRYTDKIDSVYVEYDEQGNWVDKWKYFGDTITVNKQLLEPTDSVFVDYDVVPGETYYYTIKQMTTALNTYNVSNPVAATPLTATKGDANGSMAVDVADVVTEISWLSNQNPKPFIFEAADVNSDQAVNILDVVGTINIITQPVAPETLVAANNASAQYFVENGVLYVETPVTLGGIQVSVKANPEDEITAMDDLKGFEQTGVWKQEGEYLFLAYSMSGRTLAPGRHALLRIGKDNGVKEMILSDARGKNVLAINGDATGIGKVENMQLQLPTPNPFSTVLNVPYVIGQEGMHHVKLTFCDIAGRTVHSYTQLCGYGKYTYTWHPTQQMQRGLYLVNFHVNGKLMQSAKVIYMP